MTKLAKHNITKHKVIISVAIFLILVIGASLFFLYAAWQNNQGKIYSRTYLGSYNLSGLNKDEALKIIKGATDKIDEQGLSFELNNKKINVLPLIASGPDTYADNIFSLDPTANLEEIYRIQGQSFASYLSYQLRTLFKDKKFAFAYQLDAANLTKVLGEAFKDQEIPAVNASFKLTSAQDLSFSVIPETNGKIINYEQALSEVQNNLATLSNPLIFLKTKTDYPEVYQKDLPDLTPAAKKILARGDLILTYQDKNWTLKPEEIASFLKSEKKDRNFYLTLDEEKIKNFLTDKIAPEIDKEPILPRFSIVNTRLANWQTGLDGQKLNLDINAQKIKDEFINQEKNNITLQVDVIKTESLSPANDFNIKEIIGTGQSDFSGSPANRRHNIKVGAAALNGLLIKPGEEFSLVKVLGNVDAASGYLPELVIKDNKTIPEYGGGLCQIGTTAFRAAIQSGLPITERRNHSYRVVYYEPAGMDAAIYIPHPDVRFLNDTGNYILIQARIEKNNIYFDFWGVKDGRQVTISKPTIYNIVKPAPTRIVESTDLKPGEKKCTEKAHNGADAYFDYKVIYPRGAAASLTAATSSNPLEKNVRFSSHYVPWQEVCLVGVATSTATSSATSTPGNTATSTNTTGTTTAPAVNTGTSTSQNP